MRPSSKPLGFLSYISLTLVCSVAASAGTILYSGPSSATLVSAPAVAFSVTLTFDEFGNGNLTNTSGFFGALPASKIADPVLGGLSSVLFYGMLNPPGMVGGDLIIDEPGTSTPSDILRFNPDLNGGGVFVYSDIADGVDSLADVGMPSIFETNSLTVVEVGPEGANGFTYTPTAGQPGFVAGAGGPVTYVFLSDGLLAPEPSTVVMALSGIAALGLRRFWKQRR